MICLFKRATSMTLHMNDFWIRKAYDFDNGKIQIFIKYKHVHNSLHIIKHLDPDLQCFFFRFLLMFIFCFSSHCLRNFHRKYLFLFLLVFCFEQGNKNIFISIPIGCKYELNQKRKKHFQRLFCLLHLRIIFQSGAFTIKLVKQPEF